MAPRAPRWNASAQRWEQGEDDSAFGGSGRGWREWVALAAVVVAVVVAGLAVWAAGGEGGSSAGERGSQASSSWPSASDDNGAPGDNSPQEEGEEGTDGAESEEPDVEGPADPSAEVEFQEGPPGSSFEVPTGWERSEQEEDNVFFDSPDGRQRLQVFVVAHEGETAKGALEESSEARSAETENYMEGGITEVSSGEENPSGDAHELTYSYWDEEAGERRQVIQRAFTATDGTLYSVVSTVLPSSGEKARAGMDIVTGNFSVDEG